ncbi:MAG TPA: hypothetical protein VFX73_06265, partial [Chitinophagaceae bacterium]|nr:hypothetical protein [Chitinophagaceae bacterium]
MKKITALTIIVIICSSCFNNYYKVRNNNQWNEDLLQTFQKSEKHIVIHFTNGLKELANPVFNTDQISGELKNYQPTYRYIDPDTSIKENFKYKYRDRKILFSEFHVYVNENFTGQQNFTITEDNFVNSYANIPNKGLSIFSHALGVTIILGVTALLAYAAAAAATVAVVMAFNCPQAYVETTPGQYQFIGGLFTGAVRQDLQRNDMIPLTGLSDA